MYEMALSRENSACNLLLLLLLLQRYYICWFLHRRLIPRYFGGSLQSSSVHKLNYMKQENQQTHKQYKLS